MEKLSKIISPIFSWITLGLISVIAILGILITHHTLVASFSVVSNLDKKVVNQNDSQDLSDNKLIDCSCEKTFKQSYPVIWSGKVIASFVGGEDIGVERFSKEFKYNKFYVDAQGKYNESLGSDIRVTGRLVGITCAYANSIFKECVGEVVADEITPFK